LVVDIADDGQKGLEAVQRNPYDLVLMDIQMPVMDGYTATREIRKWERQFPKQPSPIPIIAMTANAMTGDRDKALAAGMNEHVAKPIDVKNLFSTLLRFINPGERELPFRIEDKQKSPDNETESSLPELAGIDIADGLGRVGGNKGLYRKILKKFRMGNLEVMAKIREEVSRKDFEQAKQLVHGIKGASGNIGAIDLFEASRILDEALKLEEKAALDELLENLSSALGVVMASLSELETLEEVKKALAQDHEPAAVNMEQIREIMIRLKTLLEDDDAESAQVLDSLKEQLKVPEARLHLQELTSQISGYDFEEALSPLASLARDLDITL
jgi:two-component system, sensor histidine kinase and response regulator